MPIVIHSNLPLLAAQGVTAPVVLQPGSVISARVQQVLTSDTVRIVISGQALDVQSQVSLQAGQVLQLAVSQTADGGIALAVVSQQAAPASQSPSTAVSASVTTTDSITLAPQAAAAVAAQTAPAASAAKVELTLPEALAVSVAVQSAAAQQTSLAQLFANLGVAAGLDNLAPQVQQAVALVLAQRTPLNSSLTGDDINQAFQNSGLFLEASLASGSFSSSTASTDLKAALIVLRQVLANSLGTVTPSAPSAPGTTQSAPASALSSQQSPAPAVAAAPQGATPATASVQQVATPVAATPQSASAPASAVPQGTPATAAAQQPATIVLAAAFEQGAQPPPIRILTQQVTLTAELETPIVASPALAPVQVEPAATSVPAPAAAAASTAPNTPGAAVANALTAAASGSADAAARAAATTAALNLLQEALQAAPPMAANSWGQLLENGEMLSLIPAVAGARSPEGDEIELSRSNVPPPPISGALPAPQPVLPATLVSNSAAEAAMHRLLADTDAAIARQTLLQVASLPGQTDQAPARLDPAAPRWNFEIPFATPQGTAMAQFEISRDGGGNDGNAAKRVWRARFSLDVEPAGPVHALVSLSGDRTSVRLWAERPTTAAQLRAGATQLSQALSRAELRPGDILVQDGAPAQSAPARAGHFLDRAL